MPSGESPPEPPELPLSALMDIEDYIKHSLTYLCLVGYKEAAKEICQTFLDNVSKTLDKEP